VERGAEEQRRVEVDGERNIFPQQNSIDHITEFLMTPVEL